MFYTGDLQTGIALALQQSKAVACFVRNDNEESLLWENEHLKDEQITTALSARAVTLRIDAGSQEAGHLAAYYPTPVVPCLIVIHNGKLLLDLRAGESRAQFKVALLTTLVTISSPASEPEAAPSSSNSAPQSSSPFPTSNQPQITMPSPSPVPIPSAANTTSQANTLNSSTPSSSGGSAAVASLLADRRRRLEVDKKEKDAAEKAERKAKADARREAMNTAPSSAKAKQATYAQQQRQRQHEARLERERIVRQIEHDKVERREKEERRKALAREETNKNSEANQSMAQGSPDALNRPQPTKSKECAMQVRIFDGSTIRSRFPSNQTLRTNVRAWVDGERSDGDIPYTFKQILAPMPNRILSISEEEESLQDLGLTPSATLVMVPVQGYTAAYSGDQGLIHKGASLGYNVVSSGARMVTGAMGTFLGLGRATAAQPENNITTPEGTEQASDPASRTSSINVRTLHDQRQDRGDHQLYNGNQLNFEPRNDADKGD